MRKTIEKAIRDCIEGLGVSPPEDIELEVPKDDAFGDLSTPVAMGLAKTLKRPPREIALEMARKISVPGIFGKVEVAGPGFINFTFTEGFLYKALKSLLAEGPVIDNIGGGRRVQVEFVSANPTGPLHLGHGRGAALGCALSNLLERGGYKVEKEYYINDAGRQVRLLAMSAFARYKALYDVSFPFPEDGYKGQYVSDIAKEKTGERGDKFAGSSFEDCEEFFKGYCLDKMMSVIKKDLEDFGVSFDAWQSEKQLYESGDVGRMLDYLKAKGFMYESEGAVWFKAASFGDEKDRVVVKSDGEHTYFASDIAYHMKKVEKGYDGIINIWGADHHGYIPRLSAVIEALGYDRRKLKVLLVQMVSLTRAGKPVQMSKRSGEFITLRDVMEEVGADTAKFIFLTRRSDSHLSFDLEAAKAASAENPVFYVQYANARINSIFARSAEAGIDAAGLDSADHGLLTVPEEIRIIKKLLTYPMVVEGAVKAREPHRVTFYLQELSGIFHPYYNKYRVVTEDAGLTNARLSLCGAVRSVLRDGLMILGVTAPERM